MNRRLHWDTIWRKYQETEVSWYQEKPAMSIDLIRRHVADKRARILDVGGGSSRLVDHLLQCGYDHIGVLDISEYALELAEIRLGDLASSVDWIVSDVFEYKSPHPWDVWHDRAVFHFLVEALDRQSYVQSVKKSIGPNSTVLIGTFGLKGPEKCSGLEVKRYSPKTLCEEFGSEFTLVESQYEIHKTPDGKDQQFVYCVFHYGLIHKEKDV